MTSATRWLKKTHETRGREPDSTGEKDLNGYLISYDKLSYYLNQASPPVPIPFHIAPRKRVISFALNALMLILFLDLQQVCTVTIPCSLWCLAKLAVCSGRSRLITVSTIEN